MTGKAGPLPEQIGEMLHDLLSTMVFIIWFELLQDWRTYSQKAMQCTQATGAFQPFPCKNTGSNLGSHNHAVILQSNQATCVLRHHYHTRMTNVTTQTMAQVSMACCLLRCHMILTRTYLKTSRQSIMHAVAQLAPTLCAGVRSPRLT